MSPYLFLLLCAGLFVQLGGLLVEEFHRTEDGTLYGYLGTTMSYSAAKEECAKKGGGLATITKDFFSTNASSLMSFFLSVTQGTSPYYWLGVNNFLRQGGRLVGGRFLEKQYGKPLDGDCGTLFCVDVNNSGKEEFCEWGFSDCFKEVSLAIVCQLGLFNITQPTTEMPTTEMPTTEMPTTQMPTTRTPTTPKKTTVYKRRERKRRVQKPKEAKPLVMAQTDEHFYITGLKPVVDKRVSMITVCGRLCRGICRYTNYNPRTGHCRGYAGGELTGKKDTNWQLWEYKPLG